MKKFTFTLQTVHNVREMKQENEHLILTQLQNEAEKAAMRIRQIEEMHREAIENYTHRLRAGEPINAFELEINSNHISTLDRLRREAEEILAQKKSACAKQSEAVAAATRAVKITSRLRETQESRHKLEVNRAEQNASDELVASGFARRMTQK